MQGNIISFPKQKNSRELLFGILMTELNETSTSADCKSGRFRSFDGGVGKITEENHLWQSGKATCFRESGQGHIRWKRVPTTGPGRSRLQKKKKEKKKKIPKEKRWQKPIFCSVS